MDQNALPGASIRGTESRSVTPVFAVESYAAVIDELKILIPANWEELGVQRDIPPDPDYDFYERANRAGIILFHTVRIDGRLAGYAIFTVFKSPRYKTRTWATCDLLWLDSKFRKLGIGRQFQRFWDADLEARGVDVVCIDVNVEVPDLMYMLKSDGYVTRSAGMDKRLGCPI